MVAVNLGSGEAEIYAVTQAGVFPSRLANFGIKNSNALETRPGTMLVSYLSSDADGEYMQFARSIKRKWWICVKKDPISNKELSIEIYSISDIDNKQLVATIPVFLYSSATKLQFIEVDNSINEYFELAENKIIGKTGIFVIGGETLLILDDTITSTDRKEFRVITEYKNAIPTKHRLRHSISGLIFQQRLWIIQSELTLESETEFVNQSFTSSCLKKFDNFASTDKQGKPLSAINSPIVATPALANGEYLLEMSVVLSCIYLTTSAGQRIVRSSDPSSEFITIETIVQEQISYTDPIAERCFLFNGLVTYATRSGLRAKSPYSLQPRLDDIGDAPVQIMAEVGNIKQMEYSPKNHRLLILLEDGTVKAISEGVPLGNGAKSFPLTTYINDPRFRILDISINDGIVTFYVRTQDNYILLLEETDNYTPLCDGISSFMPKAEIIDSYFDTEYGSVIIKFEDNSPISIEGTTSVYIYIVGTINNIATPGWYNFYRTNDSGLYACSVDLDESYAPSLAGRIVKYIPSTDDLLSHLPPYYRDADGISFEISTAASSASEEIIDSWYTPALKLKLTSGTEEFIVGKDSRDDFQTTSGPKTFIYSNFFNADYLLNNGVNGKQKSTKLSSYSIIRTSGSGAKTRYFEQHNKIVCGLGLNELGLNLSPIHDYGDGYGISKGKVKTPTTVESISHAKNYRIENPLDQVSLLYGLNWVYMVFTVNFNASDYTPEWLIWYNGQLCPYFSFVLNTTQAADGSAARPMIFDMLSGFGYLDEEIYLSSTYLTDPSTFEPGFNYRDINQAKNYFCSRGSGGERWRPKVIPHRGKYMHFQDINTSNPLKSISEYGAGIYDIITNVDVDSVNLSQILNEKSRSLDARNIIKQSIKIDLFTTMEDDVDRALNLFDYLDPNIVLEVGEFDVIFFVTKYTSKGIIDIPNVGGYQINCKVKQDFDQFFTIRGKTNSPAKIVKESNSVLMASIAGNATAKDNTHTIYIEPKTISNYNGKKTGFIMVEI
jgi:hypothetical protein